jgi:hypothetical protein
LLPVRERMLEGHQSGDGGHCVFSQRQRRLRKLGTKSFSAGHA